ncbi:anhydro-N-acetylmuramic acid kinase [Xaviernesmea oryzae]|uniref:Anhydro-N-acetylmuramic acid kinase n=1 Tax=Xaviernesmea oryzae TaxID=464029 RepID=A0A1Q9AWF4_9HYPH|nr:anhydro-N-acetylmuramic acid kinase [Xaviernesmea oryzae]OLP59793.1 anhydro-N-acetylmuramic acid kinase [Xaviernesmea oryzae]SEK51908.1 anhydro-N-acetylmuramic acid kinase [Xaviernesmea oryzae]
MTQTLTAIGLMSGTSLDGIDVALVSSNGETVAERGPFLSLPYAPSFRRRLADALETAKAIEDRAERPGLLARLERDLTLLHAVAVNDFLHMHGLDAREIDVIGFHGQTILHRPLQGLTVQLGDGPLLARESGIQTVYDMRAHDMVLGGQGAPLIPAYHAALARALPAGLARPVVFVNIGGISNLTFLDDATGALLAFDSGPGNTLIDQWVEAHTGVAYDVDGRLAAAGTIDEALVKRYLAHPFFHGNHRRALDRNDFAPPIKGTLTLEDGARTLARVTAVAILASARHLPGPVGTYVICGGGRHNPVILGDLSLLADQEGARVITAETAGFDGDAMEAEAWGFLAIRSLKGLPLTYPGTTGVSAPAVGGVLARP